MKTPEQIVAEAFVQSWDQHIGQDGAIAVLNALDAAGLEIVPKSFGTHITWDKDGNRVVTYLKD